MLAEMLAVALLLLGAFSAAGSAQLVSLPRHGTGHINCIRAITNVRCTVDARSGFVAGVGLSYGKGYGFRDACSTGTGPDEQPPYQLTWNMADTNATAFPKLPNGQPDPAYYYPPTALTTQVIVLQAKNPWGNAFGVVPAIIFVYLGPPDGRLGFAVCGNADYARFYLNPGRFPPPPTPVVLQRNYVSPLSDSGTATYLGSFDAKCSQTGSAWGTYGTAYLGGDPNTSSKNFIINLIKVCFAPAQNAVQFNPIPVPPPFTTNATGYAWWDSISYQPCFYKAHSNGKPTSPSASCAATGQVIATGKWGAIMVDSRGQSWEMSQDARSGDLVKVAFKGAMFSGVLPANQGN